MSRPGVWDVLQIEATDDPTAIRRAYARRLKVTQPEDDPKGFQALREAYDQALWYAEHRRRQALFAAEEGGDEDEDSEEDFEFAGDSPPVAFRPDGAPHAPRPRRERPEPLIRSPAPAPVEPEAKARSLEEELLARELERESQALREAAETLERLLQAQPFDETAAVRQLSRVLNMPALQNLDLAAGVEGWIENVLLSNLPNADALIPLAVKHFNWRRDADNPRRQIGDGALARDEDLTKLRDLLRKRARYQNAARALMSRPTRLNTLRWILWPGLAKDVAEVLKAIRTERPGLMQNLDAESVAWWDGAPDRPRLGPGAILLALVPPVGLWLWLASLGEQAVPPQIALLLLAGGLVCSVAIGLGIFHGVIRPRSRWLASRQATAPPWIRWGWAPLALAAPLAAAALVSLGVREWSAMVPVAILGLAAVVWAKIVGERDTSAASARAMNLALEGPGEQLGRLILRNVYLATFWAFLPIAIPLDQWLPLTLGVVAALLAFTDGLGGLKARISAMAPARRLRLYLPIAIGVIAAMILVAGFGRTSAQAWLAVLVALLAIVEPVADAVLTEDAMRHRAGIMIPLLGVLWMFLPMLTLWLDGALRINGVWLLSGWLIALGYAAARDRKLAHPGRVKIRFGNIP